MNKNYTKVDILNKCKKYLVSNNTKKNILDSNIFFCSFAKVPSFYKLKYFIRPNIVNYLKYIKSRCKSFLSALNFKSYDLYYEHINEELTNVVFTYGIARDFHNSKFTDRYFSNLEIDNSLKIVIYLDEVIPSRIPANIIILKQAKGFKLRNFTEYVRKFGFKLLKEFSAESVTSMKVFNLSEHLTKILKDIKEVHFLYESQNFNLAIINFFKSKNIKTFGYIHSIPPAMPSNLIFKEPSPDKLFVSGIGVKKLMIEHLNWREDLIENIKSIRFERKSPEIFLNYIFLPIQIINNDIIINSLNNFFLKTNISTVNLKIKEHPISEKTKKNKKFLNDLNKVLKRYEKAKVYNNFSIFVGSTSSVIEALENDITSYHLVTDKTFEMYSEDIFDLIKTKKVSENIFEYILQEKNSYIKYA